jgi:hypothetical protein
MDDPANLRWINEGGRRLLNGLAVLAACAFSLGIAV